MSVTWKQFGDILVANAKEKRVPLLGQFELTSRCNLTCRMCYVCNKANAREIVQKERSAREWIELAGQVRDAGVLYLLLTGGEVFLHREFEEIYSAIADMGFSLQLYTNGTLITPEIARFLGKKPPAKVSVTLYGASPETYEAVTGNAAAFEKAVRGIDLLKAEGILTSIRTTTVGGNKADIAGIFDIAHQRGIKFGMVQYVSPRREGSDTDPLAARMGPEESIRFGKDMWAHIHRKTEEGKDILPDKPGSEPVVEDIDNIIEQLDFTHHDSAFLCSAGHCAFWVTWDGRMTPCGMMSEPAVEIFGRDFGEAWEELKTKCDAIPKAAGCEACDLRPYCVTCPAKLKMETGSYTECPDYLKMMALETRRHQE